MLRIVALAVLPLFAQQQADRVKEVGGKFLCMCNCGRFLRSANHVAEDGRLLLKELGAMVNRGDSRTKHAGLGAGIRHHRVRRTAEVGQHGGMADASFISVRSRHRRFLIMNWRKQAPARRPSLRRSAHSRGYERARSMPNRGH